MVFPKPRIWAQILLVLGIWGALQLSLMGVAYYVRSPVMHLDILHKQSKEDNILPPEIYLRKVYELYGNASRRCFVAAVLYLFLLSSLTFLLQTPLTRSSKY